MEIILKLTFIYIYTYILLYFRIIATFFFSRKIKLNVIMKSFEKPKNNSQTHACLLKKTLKKYVYDVRVNNGFTSLRAL